MDQFYKELKEIRESRKISLEDISERTKINVQYLIAIESGKFSEIETPYLRLFLRAYAEEIGGNSQRALEQLDSFMGTKRPAVVSGPAEDENNEIEGLDLFNKSGLNPKKLRNDYFMGAIFSLILIFAIIIFQKIFDGESNAINTESGPVLQNMIKPITQEDLLKDYILDETSEELLYLNAPYFIKIKTTEQTAFTFIKDSVNSLSRILNANQENNLETNSKISELIFSSTVGLSMFINSMEIKQVSNYENPLRLFIRSNPSSISIERFKPLP